MCRGIVHYGDILMSTESTSSAHHADAAGKENPAPRLLPRCAHGWRGHLRIALYAMLPLLAWRAHADWHYWQTVWTQGTLWPEYLFLDDSVACTLAQQSPAREASSAPFDLRKASVSREEIMAGGPAKDGIPALTRPKMLSVEDAKYLSPADRVIGISMAGESKAYPLRILNHHEIVNDVVGETPVAVTFCPLCDSVAVFDRKTPIGEREFGVSGLLYNSNVLMYDRQGQPESLWSQLQGRGISGAGLDKSLQSLPVEVTAWADWRERHPQTTVMSPETGHVRDYDRNPYEGYADGEDLMFPVKPSSKRFAAKMPVLGLWSETKSLAVPANAFGDADQTFDVELNGKRASLSYSAQHHSIRVVKADEGVQWMYAYWFAWYAFHPDTTVYTKPQ
jgi:hypothetical protein